MNAFYGIQSSLISITKVSLHGLRMSWRMSSYFLFENKKNYFLMLRQFVKILPEKT